MKAKTKRMILRSSINFPNSLIVGILTQIAYELTELPDINIHRDYYVITGLIANLSSSLIGILTFESSAHLIKKYLIREYADRPIRNITIDFSHVEINNNESQSKFSNFILKNPIFTSNISWRNLIYNFSSILLGMGSSHLLKALVETLSRNDDIAHQNPLSLGEIATNIATISVAIIVYKHKELYNHLILPALNSCSFFKQSQETRNLTEEHSSPLKGYNSWSS